MLHCADHRHTLLCVTLDRMFFKFSPRMGARNNTQGPILLGAVVKMQPHRDHALQDTGRRLNVQNSCLDRPCPISFGLHLLTDGNGHVLMPRNFPIGSFGLVKKDSAYRARFAAQYRLD